MKKFAVFITLALSFSAFAQQNYNLSNLKKTEQGLYADKQGKLVSGTVKGHKVEYDLADGLIVEMRMYDDQGLLLGYGIMDDDGIFTGTTYHHRADGSVRFEIVMVNGKTVEAYCVQGGSKRLLTTGEMETYEEPDCK